MEIYNPKHQTRICEGMGEPNLQADVGGKVNSFAITGDVRTPSAPETAKVAWSRSNFRASGWKEEDFLKPIVTIAAPYSKYNKYTIPAPVTNLSVDKNFSEVVTSPTLSYISCSSLSIVS